MENLTIGSLKLLMGSLSLDQLCLFLKQWVANSLNVINFTKHSLLGKVCILDNVLRNYKLNTCMHSH